MELFFRSFVLIALLALSGAAYAVGMGGINVSSALGEPLNAEIELAGIGNKSATGGSLTARIASPDVFKVAGLDYPYTLPQLKFNIESRASGEQYLRITSASPVNDPFVTLLVELNWPTGRLLREYTFLLDPPGFRPEQPAEPKVKPLAPIEASSSRPSSVESVNVAPARTSAASPSVANAPISSTPVPANPAQVGRTSSGKIIIKSGDTLRSIAKQAAPADISLERMLVALYRANADEFDGHNMNRIRVGRILRIPSATTVEQVTQAEAMQEIHVQAADWNVYRQKLAAASVTAKEPVSRQEVSGKISAKVADQSPAAKAPTQEVVRLSKGEAPGDKAVAGAPSRVLQEKMAGLQEELIAKDIRLKDNSNRIALLEKNIKEMQHLVELKNQTMASAKVDEPKPAPAAETQEASTTKATTGTAGESAAPVGVAKETPKAKQPTPVAAPPGESLPPPSIMDELIGNPLYFAGFAVVLLALGGGLLYMVRRGRRNQSWGNLEKSISEPVIPAPVFGESTQTTAIINTPVVEEAIDPVSEADLFLNFGRDTQAEEILKDALEKDPKNQLILLKLLSIYQARKDTRTFYAIAQKVRELGDASIWAQAAAMGRKLEPDNPEYVIENEGQSEKEDEAENVGAETVRKEPTSHGLDFDLDFGGEKFGTGTSAIFEVDQPAASSALDFDLGDAMSGIGSVAKGAATDEKTSQFSVDNNQLPERSGTQPGSIGDTSISIPLQFGEAAAGDDVIDITSQSTPMSLSLPVGEIEFSKTGTGGEGSPADDEVIDITSKSMSMSLPIGKVEVGEPDVASGDESGEDDFFDITSVSMHLKRSDVENSITTNMTAPLQSDSSLFQGIDLSLGASANDDSPSAAKGVNWAEVATKIDLAKAYQEMGDAEGAQEILSEVMDEGDAQQRATAKSMLEQLAS